jgi:light-regulated signal transduction histidine kinase (bacteriophytochrome)
MDRTRDKNQAVCDTLKVVSSYAIQDFAYVAVLDSKGHIKHLSENVSALVHKDLTTLLSAPFKDVLAKDYQTAFIRWFDKPSSHRYQPIFELGGKALWVRKQKINDEWLVEMESVNVDKQVSFYDELLETYNHPNASDIADLSNTLVKTIYEVFNFDVVRLYRLGEDFTIKSKFCCKFPFSKTPIFMSV